MLILVIRRNADDMFNYMNELRELLARTEMCHDKIIQHSRDELIVGDVKIRFMTGSCGINTFIGLKPDYYHINGLTFGSILSAELVERGAKRLYTIGDIANTISKHLKEKEKESMAKPVTNFEFYKDKLIECGLGTTTIAVTKHGPSKCTETNCDNCIFKVEGIYHCNKGEVTKWLYAEHKEMPTITNAEREFLKILNPKHWLARDRDGALCVYSSIPYVKKYEDSWNTDDRNFACVSPYIFPNIELKFITWESLTAWKVEDLLKLEVK